MVRRTRSFIQDNYAQTDPDERAQVPDLRRWHAAPTSPTRQPKTVHFRDRRDDPNDQYARLYADDVVDTINGLSLPRYGLGNYCQPTSRRAAHRRRDARSWTTCRAAGERLMGFCRTNLFKRLESSGHAFFLSVERHILRNYVSVHALENDLPLPIGTQDVGAAGHRFEDERCEDDASAICLTTTRGRRCAGAEAVRAGTLRYDGGSFRRAGRRRSTTLYADPLQAPLPLDTARPLQPELARRLAGAMPRPCWASCTRCGRVGRGPGRQAGRAARSC